jgi:hypothetical protein
MSEENSSKAQAVGFNALHIVIKDSNRLEINQLKYLLEHTNIGYLIDLTDLKSSHNEENSNSDVTPSINEF